MKNAIINFMLIDDNPIDLFINRKFIERTTTEAEIVTFLKPVRAIDYLGSLDSRSPSEYQFIPDIIFLDINMPDMNGFEFLDAYGHLEQEKLSGTKLFLLSASSNLKDQIDANAHAQCNGFIRKPLSCEAITDILDGFVPKIKMTT